MSVFSHEPVKLYALNVDGPGGLQHETGSQKSGLHGHD